MTDREAMQQWMRPGAIVPVDMNTVRILLDALRERLAQPEQWQGLAADSTIQTVPAQGGLLPAQFGIRGCLTQDTQNKEQNR